MLVDDSAVVRGIFRRTLEADSSISIVAAMGNGQMAVDSIAKYKPEVIVLDVEMPVMNGMEALPKLLAADPHVKVIMASTLTTNNAAISLEALTAGAADYIPKPEARYAISSADDFKRDLIAKVKALGHARRGGTGAPPLRQPATSSKPAPLAQHSIQITSDFKLRAETSRIPSVLCVGSSTGGPQALASFLGALGPDFKLPTLVTQHMPKTFTPILADHLRKASGRPCEEATDGMPLEPGRIYVAPGGTHMLVVKDGLARKFKLDDGPPESFCKPAVDPMLRSVVEAYGGKEILTVILTGMGQDGMLGATVVADDGGMVLAQDEASSVVWGMPGAAASAGLCCAVLPLDKLAAKVKQLIGRPKA